MTDPIQLTKYDNSWYKPGGSLFKRAAWFFLGQPVMRAGWIPSSSLRVFLLRLFGARIGSGVVIKPAVDVKYPWHLVVGNDCWIGERTWIDNLTTVSLGTNVCVSQGAHFCTGNHDWTDPNFGLRIAPIHVADGAWIGAKSLLTPGVVLGAGAIATAGSIVTGSIGAFEIFAGNPARFVKTRTLKTHSSCNKPGSMPISKIDSTTCSSNGEAESQHHASPAELFTSPGRPDTSVVTLNDAATNGTSDQSSHTLQPNA